MTLHDQGWNRERTELLMDVTATLSEHTQQAEDFAKIPGYLCGVLRLESLSLAIVREVKDGTLVVLGAASSADSAGNLEQDLLTLFQQTRPLVKEGSPRPTDETLPVDVTEVPVPFQAEYPRATVFTQTMEAGHSMLLVVHQRAHDPHLSAALTETLQAVARPLCKLLSCLVTWMTRPEAPGAPFDRLTDREWMVLRGLNSESGEKQLADQLGLSPHTLHSHIKSIYRKVGVQGRLPLLLRAQEAMRELRVRQMNGHVAAETEQPTAVAVY